MNEPVEHPEGHEAFSDRLREAMSAKGYSMRSLSEAANLGPTTVRDILERGRSPSLRTLHPLAAALGVSVAWLSGGEGEPPQDAGTPYRLKNLRVRAGLSMRKMAEVMGLKGASSYQRYEDPALFSGYLPMEWRFAVMSELTGKGDPAITTEEVDRLFMPSGDNLSHAQVNVPHGHIIVIRRAAIEAAERIVAQAGPINAAPRDIVRQIMTEVFGFQMEGGAESR